MGIKSLLAKPYAKYIAAKVRKQSLNALPTQENIFKHLIAKAALTEFGKTHHFNGIRTYEDFTSNIPLTDYEKFQPWLQKIRNGEPDITWPGNPVYICKTSGTTSGIKHIPITRESMPHHITSVRNALLMYIAQTGNADFVNGKMVFLQGSPLLTEENGIKTGRLSGIAAHYVPAYLQGNRLPSFKTNCIDDWETKVEAIVQETAKKDMRLIGGVPSWTLGYFDTLLKYTEKKTVKEIFPYFSLYVYGGLNFEPYRERFKKVIGCDIPTVQLYPASEGFIAYQDDQHNEGMLLVTNGGIFFEFVDLENFDSRQPEKSKRIWLQNVELNKNYALVINSNAGLWGYVIGDTIKFISKHPYRIIVTGRIHHYTSAFGEHVMMEEVDYAMKFAIDKTGAQVVEYTLAPMVNPATGLPYHEWLVEFAEIPEALDAFKIALDEGLCEKNVYYRDLLKGKVLRPLELTVLKKQSFHNYMKENGKLGGQHKIPRLSNNRQIAEALYKWKNN